jgi:hypothetical protein
VKIARNLALIGLMALGLLAVPTAQAGNGTCGACSGCSKCNTYACGILWLALCCQCANSS